MKKLLTLIRHAKSSWEYNVIDHERPLKERGINDANLIAKALYNLNLTPNLVMISDAKRTRATAQIILPQLNVSTALITHKHELYDFSGELLLEAIKNCDDKIHHLMVFGHNHAITHFVNTYGDLYIENVPTCGVVQLEFLTQKWVSLTKGRTIKTLFPRDLK